MEGKFAVPKSRRKTIPTDGKGSTRKFKLAHERTDAVFASMMGGMSKGLADSTLRPVLFPGGITALVRTPKISRPLKPSKISNKKWKDGSKVKTMKRDLGGGFSNATTHITDKDGDTSSCQQVKDGNGKVIAGFASWTVKFEEGWRPDPELTRKADKVLTRLRRGAK